MDNALAELRSNVHNNPDVFSDLENDGVQQQMVEAVHELILDPSEETVMLVS